MEIREKNDERGPFKVSLSLSPSLSPTLKGLILYTGGVLFHLEWCIR